MNGDVGELLQLAPDLGCAVAILVGWIVSTRMLVNAIAPRLDRMVELLARDVAAKDAATRRPTPPA